MALASALAMRDKVTTYIQPKLAKRSAPLVLPGHELYENRAEKHEPVVLGERRQAAEAKGVERRSCGQHVLANVAGGAEVAEVPVPRLVDENVGPLYVHVDEAESVHVLQCLK